MLVLAGLGSVQGRLCWGAAGQRDGQPAAHPGGAQALHLRIQLLRSSSSLYPISQPHWKDPSWFWHVCSHPPLWEEHSSTSKKHGILWLLWRNGSGLLWHNGSTFSVQDGPGYVSVHRSPSRLMASSLLVM